MMNRITAALCLQLALSVVGPQHALSFSPVHSGVRSVRNGGALQSGPPLVGPLHASFAMSSGVDEQVEKLRAKAAALRAEVSVLEAERAKEMAEAIKNLFQRFDLNQDGKISADELQVGLENVFKMKVPETRVARLIESFDANQDGALQLDEFVGLEKLHNRLEALVVEEKQTAREAAKAAKEEEAAAKLMEAQLELINDGAATAPEKVLSVLPYLFPLLDSLQFGRFLILQHPDNAISGALSLLYAVYTSIPFSGFLAFFLLSSLSTNLSINQLIRFNMQQAIFLDVSLFLPGLIATLSVLAASGLGVELPPSAVELGSDAVFLSMLAAVAYSTVSSLLGKSPDSLPFISSAVNDRMPTDDMIEEAARIMLEQQREEKQGRDDRDERNS